MGTDQKRDQGSRDYAMIAQTVKGFKVTTQYGVIDKLHKTPHTGIDIALPEGSPLYSIGRGVVENVVNYGDNNIGQGVIVKLDNGLRAIYGHIAESKVSPGDQIEPGQLLALSGTTGRSTGPHVHFMLKEGQTPIDPTKYAAAAVEHNNRWVPDFIEKPYGDLTTALEDFNTTVDKIGYWLNPKNLFTEAWQGLDVIIHSPDTALFIIAATIIGFWLIALGLKLPKKILFWGWIIYWILRGFVFV
jgi:hypothetical protein